MHIIGRRKSEKTCSCTDILWKERAVLGVVCLAFLRRYQVVETCSMAHALSCSMAHALSCSMAHALWYIHASRNLPTLTNQPSLRNSDNLVSRTSAEPNLSQSLGTVGTRGPCERHPAWEGGERPLLSPGERGTLSSVCSLPSGTLSPPAPPDCHVTVMWSTDYHTLVYTPRFSIYIVSCLVLCDPPSYSVCTPDCHVTVMWALE